MSYVRYSENLTTNGLARLGINAINPDGIHAIDSVSHIHELDIVGRAIAEKQFDMTHFQGF
jgi:hypothetical protein